MTISKQHGILAALAAGAVFLSGCFMSDGGSSKNQSAYLSIQTQVSNVNNVGRAMGKASTISLNKLIIRLTSSSNDTIRDTVSAGTQGFSATATTDQSFHKTFSVKGLRNWTVQVKTLDAKDSVIHIGTVSTDSAIKIGETRPMTLNLTSKFVMYVAAFTLPDSLRSSAVGTSAQKLYVNRLMMVVDGDTVRDSSSSPGFFASSPTVNQLSFDYIRSDTAHSVQLYVFGPISGWPSNKPLFGDTLHITTTDTAFSPVLPWTGPGSSHDTTGGAGGGAYASLTVNIGKVGLVNLSPTLGNLPKRKN